MNSNTHLSWYAMKAMGRVRPMMTYLRRLGIYSWAPFASARQVRRTRIEGEKGSEERRYADVTDNLMPLIFFRATEAQVRRLHSNSMVDAFVYRDLNAERWCPVTIPPFEVKMFRMLRELRKGNMLYFDDPGHLLAKGQVVRITGGEFKGFEGVIRRVKHNKCLYVNITGVCAVAVAYIPQCFVEPIRPADEIGKKTSISVGGAVESALQYTDNQLIANTPPPPRI